MNRAEEPRMGEIPLPLSSARPRGHPDTHPPKVGTGPFVPQITMAPWLMPCPVPMGGSAGTGDSGGDSGSMAGPWGETEPGAGDAMPQGEGGGPGTCRMQDRYCVVKGYLVAAVLGPLLMLVAAVHIVTRDKATEPGGCSG